MALLALVDSVVGFAVAFLADLTDFAEGDFVGDLVTGDDGFAVGDVVLAFLADLTDFAAGDFVGDLVTGDDVIGALDGEEETGFLVGEEVVGALDGDDVTGFLVGKEIGEAEGEAVGIAVAAF